MSDDGKIPPRLATVMWPELPSVIDEVVEEIRAVLPVYARPEDSAYDQIIKLGTGKLVTAFVERIADPSASTVERDETCRALGHFEAIEGRTLDSLHTAYRIAFHIAWKRTAMVAERENFPGSLMAAFGDAMIVYLEEAIRETTLGYQQARAQTDAEFRQARTRLLSVLLEGATPSGETIRQLAEPADWDVPDEVTTVAVAPGCRYTKSALDVDVLTDLDGDRPCLLIPGPVTDQRRAMLAAVLADASSVVGVAGPLSGAADSMRWARQVLRLATDGIIADGPLIDGEEHLVSIWLLADVPLVEYLSRKHLAPLNDLSEHNRERLTETLRMWVTSRGNAVQVSEKLQVHPQTVRYRLRQLDAYLGDVLSEPQTRFSIEMTLRASFLNRRRRASGRTRP